jgi:hypothetical protein
VASWAPGFGDDLTAANGPEWRPAAVELSRHTGDSPLWLQYNGKYGASGNFKRQVLRGHTAVPSAL